MDILRTKRLALREFEEGDLQAVHSCASDPEVVLYMNWGPNTADETKNYIQRSIVGQKAEPRETYELAVVLKEDGRLIGSCGIHASDTKNREGVDWLLP
jgi:RimJ/RimL family protein N-acetyltransferase